MTLKSSQESDKPVGSAAEAAQMAIEAGLVYVSDAEPGIRRLRVGRGSYCQGHSPMASRRRAALPDKQIEHLIGRYGDTPTIGLREAANG